MIETIFQFLIFSIGIYNLVFFIWILSSWFPIDRHHPILRFIDGLIMPIYGFLLRTFPPLRLGMIDFSPFYMIIFLYLLEYMIAYIYTFIKNYGF